MISTLKAKSYAVAVMIALLLGIVQSASAGPFDDGLDAATRGDFATALKLWRPLANQGNAEAQALLGWIYHDGQGVAPDYAEAMKWYRLAANQGNAQAQFNLGVMYRNGQGVAQNYVEALKWCRLAANQGNALAACRT